MYLSIKGEIKVLGSRADPNSSARFFKTSKDDYAAHDVFLGIPVPELRKLSKEFKDADFDMLKKLLDSSINEERQLALLILVEQYKKSYKEDNINKNKIYEFYLVNIDRVNNWNLVDSSAHYIIGAHIWNQHIDDKILFTLLASDNLWLKRIAIVATWYLIKNNVFVNILEITKILLSNENNKNIHDLLQKAAGWMLREMGKRNISVLLDFLNQYAHKMPRTMLRYSLEKLSEEQKNFFMNKKV